MEIFFFFFFFFCGLPCNIFFGHPVRWKQFFFLGPIQNVFVWLKPNTYCFCLDQHYKHGLFYFKILHIITRSAIIYRPELNLENHVLSYLLLSKGNFSGLFFFRTSRSKGEFPSGYLAIIATRLFVYY